MDSKKQRGEVDVKCTTIEKIFLEITICGFRSIVFSNEEHV